MKRTSVLLLALLLLGAPLTASADVHRGRNKSCNDGIWKYGRPVYGTGYRNNYDYRNYDRRNYDNRYDRRAGGRDALWSGIRSGQLSNAEVRDLRDDQRDIARKEAQYARDGYLSSRERADLRDEYRDFREDLNHNLRDGERRY